MRIGVFDSGIGGLTVLKELRKYHKDQEYIYFGDTKNLPYGTKSKEELFEVVCKVIDFLISKDVKIIFIACGTVSSTIYQELCNKYSVPIVSIIDATIAELKRQEIKDVAILATPATINSHVFKKKLADVNVLEISCSKFVPIIENKIDSKFKKLYVEQYLKDVKKERIKHVVLGCTHYPLLETDIKAYLGEVNCYNMGTILAYSTYLKPAKEGLEVYFSHNYEGLNEKANTILEEKINILEQEI
ncbi:MAG: glutamate racemase [Firmicutes bacterium]|nr:glutamate racemase [Bacillota bacterium]